MSIIQERIVAQGHGYLSPKFFAVHSTANPGATAANHASYWSGDGMDYAAHLVADWNECLHTVPYDRLCWQVGNGNSTCEGMEICEATNYDDFIRGLEIARAAILERLAARGWTIDGAVRSHLWFTQNYGGSDHTDPIPYFERFGWTWDRFIEFLKEEDMPSAQEIANAVWGQDINGTAASQRLYLCNWKDYDETDPTGRNVEMNDHDHIKWMAAKQAQMNAKLDAIIDALGMKVEETETTVDLNIEKVSETPKEDANGSQNESERPE